jgi:hypothetical protein
MRQLGRYLLISLMLSGGGVLLTPTPAAAQVGLVDQLVATVNNEVITRSDIVWNLALLPELPAENFTATNLQQMLQQIIDQRLLLGESAQLPGLDPTPQEISQALGELVQKFGNETAFYSRINRYGLTATLLQDILRQRLRIIKFIDFRFRAFAIVSEDEIQRYYREVLIPKLREETADPLPDEPNDKLRRLIEANLVEDIVNNKIEEFLENTRRQADVIVLVNFLPTAANP